ncbi:unnamed protein product [Lactuca virosa]|uniref:Uncharacterized protein n=1 Tax=Lactuca virosa TaxID=75947 RepID=A0AAU9M691_9ASTR|nr:unnamed protein product [Lactuca virosa]
MPLHALDESNMETIVGMFGKVMVNTSPFWNCNYVSHGKICILTASRKKLNEEISVLIDNCKFRICVFEVNDDWVPFKHFVPNSISYSEEDIDDEHGISDTWQPDGMDFEEGEIRPVTHEDESGKSVAIGSPSAN